MSILSKEQTDSFWKDGVITVEDAVTPTELTELRKTFTEWVEESRLHEGDYGKTLDGRPRFDLEPGHTSEKPGLRRVQSPEEISKVYENVMRNSKMTDYVAELIGPSIRFHHGKVNSKLPGTATKVKFHQDFLFQPMTNDDLITALLYVDDVTLENGPLEVVPGSHKGPLYPHWHNGVFTGSIDDEIVNKYSKDVIKCVGKAGSACLMHSSLLHGSAPNLSTESRTLYIATYYAEDAIELSQNHLPSKLTHSIIKGRPSGKVRCSKYEMLIPEVPKGTSFFSQQAGLEENNN